MSNLAAKSSTGLKKETSGALAYVLGPITGIIFLVLEKDKFVRFHAMQSIVVFIGLFVLQWIMALNIVILFLVPFINILMFILWLMLIYKAWQGEEWEVPFFGKYARNLASKA